MLAVALTHAPSTYKIPTANDRPRRMNIGLWAGPNAEAAIHRSKAVGEPPLMLAISVFSALTQAVARGGAWKRAARSGRAGDTRTDSGCHRRSRRRPVSAALRSRSARLSSMIDHTSLIRPPWRS